MKGKCSSNMIIYELRNINGNFMTHFWGIIFPNLMCVLLAKTVGSQVPEEIRQQVITKIMLSMSLVIPMSIMFLGYGSLYSQEVERGIPLRMRLFGYGMHSEVMAKIIAHLIFMTIGMVIYGVFQAAVMDIPGPAFSSLVCLLVSLYLLGIIYLFVSHAIALLFRKFSITFGVEMTLYFTLMILSGMMGIETSQLPEGLQKIAGMLPMTYIANDFVDFWQGGSYNFMPFIQSFLFVGAVSGLLLLFSLYKNRRIIK